MQASEKLELRMAALQSEDGDYLRQRTVTIFDSDATLRCSVLPQP
jgi:hypothetical protein